MCRIGLASRTPLRRRMPHLNLNLSPSHLRSLLSTLLFRRAGWKPMIAIMLVAELVVTAGVVWVVPYTEIDWKAYMQEVSGPIEENDWDYMNLKGDTGPLVYPAGFVYLYAVLYWLTDRGKNILRAQWMFVGFYMAFIACVYAVYYRVGMALGDQDGNENGDGKKGKRKRKGDGDGDADPDAEERSDPYAVLPPWILVLVSSSRRIHSIFVLRLFNDGLAMLLFYASVLLFTASGPASGSSESRRARSPSHAYWAWALGSLVFSLAVSVKMNVLLFAPALLFLMLKAQGVWRTITLLTICAVPQIALAIPFLQANAWGYAARAFEFSRVFTYKWTVNWKFIPEDVFISKQLAVVLLVLHLTVTVTFVVRRWFKHEGLSWKSVSGLDERLRLNAAHFTVLMFESNFIGMVFSRSIHYQFYVWYHATLPLLLWRVRLPTPLRVMLLIGIEMAFNVYPATPLSSAVLQWCHVSLLALVAWSAVPYPFERKTRHE